jgi:hypothetical protein
VTNAADCLPRPTIHMKRPGVSGPSTPRTRSRPPTPRSSPDALASASSSAASATWKPNGHETPSSELPQKHHLQTARSPARRRQPHARGTTQSRPLQPALPRPPYRRPRSAARRPDGHVAQADHVTMSKMTHSGPAAETPHASSGIITLRACAKDQRHGRGRRYAHADALRLRWHHGHDNPALIGEHHVHEHSDRVFFRQSRRKHRAERKQGRRAR